MKAALEDMISIVSKVEVDKLTGKIVKEAVSKTEATEDML